MKGHQQRKEINMNHPGTNSRTLSDDIICCSDDNDESSETSSDIRTVSDEQLMMFDNQTINVRSNNVPGNTGSNGRGNLTHSVSIVVEPTIDQDDGCSDGFDEDDLRVTPPMHGARRKTIAGPISVLEDLYGYDKPKKVKEYDDVVQSLFATARLRKEEFARLLEEHDQIVKKINEAETNLI